MKRYGNMPPVVLDGFLFVLIAICTYDEALLRSDDVYKYLNAYVVFYAKVIVGSLGAGALALKMFRSREYSDHQDAKKAAADAALPNGTTVQQQTTKVETTNEKTSSSSNP